MCDRKQAPLFSCGHTTAATRDLGFQAWPSAYRGGDGGTGLPDVSGPRRRGPGIVPIGRTLRNGSDAGPAEERQLPESVSLPLKRVDALAHARVGHS
jgi:hypothetical protein